ncbi:MAG: hypothetical protein EDM03_08695 [Porphyrobacter sp. IPPAS B-1204]|nr:MAG: hypothetical protein EDM03_08695 [Porphyrobacter sp. IPPAS B-1204]
MRKPKPWVALALLLSAGIVVAGAVYIGRITSADPVKAARSPEVATVREQGDRSVGYVPVTANGGQSEAADDGFADAGIRVCGPVPAIAFDEQTKETLPPELEPGGAALGQLKAAIDRAWASACDKGLIPAGGFKDQGKSLSAFKIANAPGANVTMISLGGGFVFLDAPMYRDYDSQIFIPDHEEIEEALYCAKYGVPDGDNPEGRCLVD